MSISRLLVSVLLVNLYLYCYTSGEAVKESELVAAEKELENIAVEDAFNKIAKDDAMSLVANDVGEKAAFDKKDTHFVGELLDLSMNQIMNDMLSKKALEDAARCHDVGGNQCKLLVKMSFCHLSKYKQKLRDYCFKSCGYCRMPSPPQCFSTKYGCCWDKTTSKQDKMGTNCRACEDRFKGLCKTFKADCYSAKGSGSFMKSNCAKTCKLCGALAQQVCFDDPKQSEFCPTWAKDGRCKDEAMKIYCKKSCGLC